MPVHIAELISQMTLEEKAGLCSGADFWHTKAVGRLGIPAMMVSDGPHGLRTQEEGKGINRQHQGGLLPGRVRVGREL